MRQVRCQLPAGGAITVHAGERGRTIQGGDVVDLDAVLVEAAGARPALTLAAALGPHVAAFAPLEEPVQTSAHTRKGRPAAAEE